MSNNSVWLRIRYGEAITAAIVVARIHHRQHDVGHGDEVLPHLTDTEVAGRGRRQTENVERDRYAEGLQAARQNRDAFLYAGALRLARLACPEDRLRHRFLRLIGEPHVV